jgi:histidyl-tRNA synthetase
MIRAIKGTRDLLPPDTAVWNRVERIAHDVFQSYNYHEIRTGRVRRRMATTVHVSSRQPQP